jgi:hypothetical protein
MGQRNQGIFSIEKTFAINLELTMALMRLIAIKYFNRLTALVGTNINRMKGQHPIHRDLNVSP